jgi:hypothetical protein
LCFPCAATLPLVVKAYITEDVVAVVLEETFTKADPMADEFKSIVEQATGRVVKAFLSETNLEADVSVEFFLLGEPRTDMEGFESGAR